MRISYLPPRRPFGAAFGCPAAEATASDGSAGTDFAREPGEHTRQLLPGDHVHILREPPLSSPQITVIVE